MIALLTLAVAAFAALSRYEPDALRLSLRQEAQTAYQSVVDATGLTLEPEKAAQIKAGLDEGVRRGRAAGETAAKLLALSQTAFAEMDKAAESRDGAELAEAAGGFKARFDAGEREQRELKSRVEALPGEDPKKTGLLGQIKEAAERLELLRPGIERLERELKTIADETQRVKDARRRGEDPYRQLSDAANGVSSESERLGALAEAAKPPLDALGQEPRQDARRRAWDKLEPARESARQLFVHADAAANRADEFKRHRAAFERAWRTLDESAQSARQAAPGLRLGLGELEKLLIEIRARLR